MDDFVKYRALRGQGACSIEIWRQAEADGVDPITRIRLLREVFCLSLVEAKEVSVQARCNSDLVGYQETLVEGLNKVLKPKQ